MGITEIWVQKCKQFAVRTLEHRETLAALIYGINARIYKVFIFIWYHLRNAVLLKMVPSWGCFLGSSQSITCSSGCCSSSIDTGLMSQRRTRSRSGWAANAERNAGKVIILGMSSWLHVFPKRFFTDPCSMARRSFHATVPQDSNLGHQNHFHRWWNQACGYMYAWIKMYRLQFISCIPLSL